MALSDRLLQLAKAFAKYCKRKSSVGACLAGVFLGDGLQALSRGGVKGNSKLRYRYSGVPASVLSSYGTPSRNPTLAGGMHTRCELTSNHAKASSFLSYPLRHS
jgi:hypothetical protein